MNRNRICILLAVLAALPESHVFAPEGKRLAQKLAPFPTLSPALCPATSVLKEFID